MAVIVSATVFARNFAEYQRIVRREAVGVISHGQPTGYFVSPEEYAELEQLRAKAREIISVGELPQNLLRDLSTTEMDPRHTHLNELMDD